MRYLVLPLLLLTACSPSIKTSSTVLYPAEGPAGSERRVEVVREFEGHLARAVARLVEDGTYPGVSAGLVVDGEMVLWAGAGLADVEREAPVTPKTVFRIASITKTMTGLAVLQLRDTGLLKLDDPVAAVVPALAKVTNVSTDSPAITWRHLVTHTSGLPRVGRLNIAQIRRAISAEEVFRALNRVKLLFSPGTDVLYSNLAWAVVGIGIGNLVGMPYRDYLTARLLEPLGIQGYWEAEEVPEKLLATGYGAGGKTWQPRETWRLGAGEAMGGLFMSAESLARWLALQMNAWPPRNGHEEAPVKRSSVRESQRIAGYGKPGASTFGVGWGLGGTPSGPQLGHTGATWAFSSVARVLPESGLGILMLANGPNSNPLSSVSYELLMKVAGELRRSGAVKGGRASPARFVPRGR